jgi:hypothetical protein
MVKEASSVSNFKKLIIPIIALVILAAAYIIIDNLPEKEDETEATEERVEIFNFKKDDLAEIKIEGRDEILWFRYVTIQVEEEETTPDGTVEKKTVDRNVWQAVEPEGMKPNTSTIDNIAWNANTLKAQKVIEESPSDLSIYGLDNPVKLTFIMKDGTQNIIDVGNKIPTGGSYYVRKEGDPTVYTIGSYEAEKFLQTKFDLMVKELYEESYTPEDFTAISYERKGAKVAVIYVIAGLIIAVIGGTLIEKLHMEKHVESFIYTAGSVDIESPNLTRKDRLVYAKEQMLSTFKKVFPYILIGVGIGAVIHNWIPEGWVSTALGSNNPFGVILATLIGVPMYADIFGTIPVAEALFAKGAQLGVILSFMMAVTTLSLPSFLFFFPNNAIMNLSFLYFLTFYDT